MRILETSTPGLRGQSGGPIFDTNGDIWAIQSRTQHYDLGFKPKAMQSAQEEHQFLNVGLGVHVQTVLGFLDQLGIKYQISDN